MLIRSIQGIVLALGLLISAAASAQSGQLNHAFGTHGIVSHPINNIGSDSVRGVAVYPSTSTHAGKVVLVGDGNESGKTQYVTTILRLNADGTLDTTFNGTGKQAMDYGTAASNFCKGVLIQSDDKILVLTEHKISASPNGQLGLTRYNANGSLDTSFGSNGTYVGFPGGIGFYPASGGMAVQKDGKILVPGNTGSSSCVVRVAANGSSVEVFSVDMRSYWGYSGSDQVFYSVALDDAAAGSQTIYAVGAVQTVSSGKYKATAIKFNSSGTPQSWKAFEYDDTASVAGSSALSLVYHDFGGAIGPRLVVGGGQNGTHYLNLELFGLALLSPSDLSFYTGFSGDGRLTGNVSGGNSVNNVNLAIQSDHKILLGGSVGSVKFGCARYNTDGSLDTTFGDSGYINYLYGSGYPTDFCLDNSGSNLVVSHITYNSSYTIAYFSALKFHVLDASMAYVLAENTGFSTDISRREEGQILRLQICMDGSLSPLNATAFAFNTNGSTNPSVDIASAKVYYTGNSSTFATTTQFGSTYNTPNGAFTIVGSQALTYGENYFWLVYKMPDWPTADNYVDAECSGITVGGSVKTPLTTAPSGARKILPVTYPEIYSSDDSTDYLINVKFAGINKDSVRGETWSGYSDYTSSVAAGNLAVGQTYQFSATETSTYWPDYPCSLIVWVDWNRDYDFEESDEFYLVANDVVTSTPKTLNISVPTTASLGTTRMRVVMFFNDNFPSSYPYEGDLYYAEAEDYALTVSAPAVVAPTTQAHSLVFSGVSDTQMKLDWTRGDGAGRAVFLLLGNSGAPAPVDGTTYAANPAFPSGDQIGTSGWYCVYNGTGTSVTVTGLTAGTTYRAMVCEYNGAAGSEKYLTSSATANPANQTTLNEYALQISAPHGSVAKSPDQATYVQGATVTLTATPATGYHFTGWTGDASSSANPLVVTMDSTKTLTANFAINTYGLTVNATHGTVGKSPDQTAYTHGTIVTLTATPATGYHFTGWTGDATTSTNPLLVTMDSTRTLTANFAINTYGLTVNATNGTVGKSPDQTAYNHGTIVTLTATPATGYHFTGWTGDATTSTNPLLVTMDSTKTLTANFAINEYALTVNATHGSVAKSPDQAVYNHGTTVTLTATPDTGYHFIGWFDGVTTRTANPLDVAMDATKTLTANFAINTYGLTVNATNGTVGKSPDQAAYNHGTIVTLTATPATGYHFTGWTGDATTSTNPLLVTMDSTRTLTANFAINTYGLTVNATNGTVGKSPDQAAYNHGTTVTLTATPDTGYHFIGWFDGVTTRTANPLDVAMDATKTLTAYFVINEYGLTLNADANGSASKSPDQVTYSHGTTVTLTATPDAHYHFTGWTGSTTSTLNPLDVALTSTMTLTAHFAIDEYPLALYPDLHGSASKSPDQTSYTYGTTVTLTATPNTGYHFLYWIDGATTVTANPYSVVMDSTRTLAALFEINDYALTVNADANGSVLKSPDQTTYTYGLKATLTAVPDAGYHFTGWTGDVTTSTNPVVLVMDSTKTLTAHFEVNVYGLTVNAGAHGSVSKSPDQTTCTYGTTVTLTATPAVGYHFTGWTGDVTSSVNPLLLTVDSTKTLTANFAINEYALEVAAEHGTVSKSPDQLVYEHGTTVTLTATPAVGYRFVGWFDGVTTRTANPLDIGMDSTKTLTANFAINEYALTVNATNGSVAKSPDQATYPYGTTVTLTATPAVGYHFTGWTGATTSTLNPLDIGMVSTKTLTAHFAINEYALTVNATNGSVAKSPDQATYLHGTTVTLTATPEVGYHFTGWFDGVTTRTANPLDVGMDSTKTLTASFAINEYALTVNATNGSVAKSPDQATYPHGTTVTLTAMPAVGYHFIGWTGATTTTLNPLDVTMDSTKTLTAHFAINTYSLTATSEGNGSVSKSPDQPTYNHGTVVTLTATPVPGYHFTGWTGTVNSSANPLDVTMDSTKTLTANFAVNTYGLTVNATNGSVSKLPNQTVYNHGTFVTLTATPAAGYHFTGWTGDVTSTMNPLSVAMDSTKTLTAHFAINTYELTATSSGHGAVSKSPDQTAYTHGSVVQLTATPETGYHFTGWTGDATGAVNPLSVTMDSTKTVTAAFAINTYALTVSATNGSVTRLPDLAVYNYGTTVTLTAKPAAGYRFSGWTGAVTSTQNPLVVTVDAAKSLTANFILQGYELNVVAVNGSVSKSPDQAAYVHGTVVALTATPETGYHFTGWTGDTTSTVNPLSITVDSTKTLTAHFAINTYAVNVPASAHGTTAKSPDLAVYPHGSTVTLTATPAVGYHFTGWSGTTSSTRNPLVLTVDSTQTLTAGFAINSYPLSVIAENGTVSKSPDQAVYTHGSAVILAATPDAFYQFVGWSGSATGTTNPLTLTMDSTKTLTARFETIEYDLAAQAVDGRVAVSPFGARQLRGTTVTLFALPNPGYSFLGWVGDVPFGQETDNPLKFSILADTSVTAVFEPVSGPVLAWGSNSLGQRDVPQPNSGYASIASGYYHSLAVKADGSVAAWGQNESGQCDLPTTNTGFVAVAAGFRHSLGLKADGSVVGWGENYSGECTAPEPNTSFTAVSAGFRYSMGLKRDGSVVVWGSDNNAALKTVPEPNTGFVAISAGYMHCLALKADGTIVAWGNNDSRQTQVPAPNADFVAVAAGMWFSLGLKADGSIVAWGQNDQGQCRVPAPNKGFVGLAAGSKHGLGLKSDGSLVAWGDNRLGQCVIAEPNIGCVAISAGAEHSLAIKTGGLLKVTLTPAEAVAAGAQWRLSDEKVGVWHNSGASVSLLAGTFTLEFKDVVGWDTPTTRSVTIRPNEFTEASATYGRHVWTLTTSSTLHGSIQVSSEGTTFTHGTSVTLTAKPDEGYLFAGWQGDVPAGQEKTNPLTLVMDSDKALKAVFELYVIRYPLTVSVAGTGSGSVQKTPDQTLYDAGTTVTLTAAPAAGSSFSGWLGDVPTGREMENPLVMVMDSTRTLTATFSLGGGGNQYSLQIATSGTGSGTVQRVPEQVVYAEGTTVTLTPLPAPDSAFTGWTGDVPGGQENANPLVVTMDATRTLTAVFTRDAVAPSVAVSSPVDNPTSATVFPMTVTFSEPVTGFTAEDLVTSNAVVSNFAAAQGASVYTFDLVVTATRFCQVTVDIPAGVAFDVANNPNTAAPQFVRSYEVAGAVAPTVQLTSNAISPTRSRAIPVAIAFDQDVTDFVVGDLALGNATAQNFLALDAKTYTVELVPVADGEVTVTVPADVALSLVGMGNRASTTTLTFLYDGTAPTALLSTVMDDPTSVSRALVKVTFSEPVTTLTLAGIEITGGTVRNLVQLDTLVYGFVVDTQVDGDVAIRIKPGVVLDGVGNANTASVPLTWTFDTLAPQVTLSAVEKTSETRIPVTVTFSEPVKGFEVSDLVTSGGVAQNLVEASETGLSYTFDFVVTTTRTATLLAVLPGGSCADQAGNANTASVPLAIFYEPKPPVLLPLDAPTSVTASDGDFNYMIAVTWNAVPEATHYQIYRSTSLDGTRIIIGPWQTATAFNDTSVEPETEYYYWVRAAADATGSRASELSEPDSGWMSASQVVPTADYKIVYRRCTFEENTLTTGSLVFKTSSPSSWVKIIRLPKGKPAKAVDRPGRIAYRTLPALPILRIEGNMRSLYSMVEIERLETSGTLRAVTAKGANIALVSAGSLGTVRVTAYRNSSPASSGTAAEFASTSIYSTQPGSPASVLLSGTILADLKSAQSFRFMKSSTKKYQVKMATGRERRISLGGIGSVAQVVEDAYGVVSSEPIVSNSVLEAPEIGLVQVTGGPVVCDRIMADVQQVRALSGQYRIPASKSQPVAVQGNVRVSEIVSGVTIRKIEARATRASGTWVGGAIGHLDDFNLLRVVAPDLGTIWGDLGVSGRFIAGTDDAGQPNCQGKIGKFLTKNSVGAFRGQAYCVKMPLFSPEKGLDFEVFLTPPVQ